jgi:hypothetical protein
MPQRALAPLTPPSTSPLRSRLWWSYQRYVFALGAVALLIAAASVTAAALLSWWWALGCLVSIPLARFAASIWSHYPRKVELTLSALALIEDKTFSPDLLRNYCGDPCYRVVADEILRYTGRNAVERREVIRAHHEALSQARAEVVVIEHTARTEQQDPFMAAGQPLPARLSVRFDQRPQPHPVTEDKDTDEHP